MQTARQRYEAEAEAQRLESISAGRRSRTLISELLLQHDRRFFTISEEHAALGSKANASWEVNGDR